MLIYAAVRDVDDFRNAYVDGWDEELIAGEDNLLIHPVCLAFICRHNDITAKQLWGAIFDHDNAKWSRTGQIDGVCYYEIEKRCQTLFNYDAYAETSHDLGWLLTRPTCLPAPKELQLVVTMGPALGSGHKVFDIPELFGYILQYVIDVPLADIESELKANLPEIHQPKASRRIFEAPSAITAAKILLSLVQVNRSFYHAIVSIRQDLFLQAMQNFGWMLPFTPADWIDSEWPDTVLRGKAVPMGPTIDWRAYMLDCLCKRTPGIRNRWRLHKVAVQFAHYREAGSLAFKPDLKRAEAKGWEVGVRWW
ncbi:hypothetical protein EDB82DRAFT_466292 [Fusarium venenatum]|nr:hypothetical protein EDB82DRAFT_466292 [Fusarium venenatum]